MPKHSPTTRGLLDAHPGVGAGKGSADRSPGWRDKYDEIDWDPKDTFENFRAEDEVPRGFKRLGCRRYRKTYGVPEPVKRCDANPGDPCTCDCGGYGKSHI